MLEDKEEGYFKQRKGSSFKYKNFNEPANGLEPQKAVVFNGRSCGANETR